jgi:RNA polymerase sigma-70 factor (ECF subfamily)
MGLTPALELPPSFEAAVDRHEREIMRYILRTTGDREDALDLFQETWLRAYRAWPRLDSAAGVRPWLFRIATNLCLNRVRDRMRRGRVIVNEDASEVRQTASADGAHYAHHAHDTHDGVLHMKTMIARLPTKQRSALIMRKIGGLEYGEIASALGCTAQAARAGVYQALKKLKAAK